MSWRGIAKHNNYDTNIGGCEWGNTKSGCFLIWSMIFEHQIDLTLVFRGLLEIVHVWGFTYYSKTLAFPKHTIKMQCFDFSDGITRYIHYTYLWEGTHKYFLLKLKKGGCFQWRIKPCGGLRGDWGYYPEQVRPVRCENPLYTTWLPTRCDRKCGTWQRENLRSFNLGSLEPDNLLPWSSLNRSLALRFYWPVSKGIWRAFQGLTWGLKVDWPLLWLYQCPLFLWFQ